MDISKQNIKQLPEYLSRFTKLGHLNVSHNQLQEVDLSSHTQLKSLDISHNPIQSFPVSVATTLNISHTHISQFPTYTELDGLKELEMYGCSFPPLSWQKLNRLTAIPTVRLDPVLLSRLQLLRNFYNTQSQQDTSVS